MIKDPQLVPIRRHNSRNNFLIQYPVALTKRLIGSRHFRSFVILLFKSQFHSEISVRLASPRPHYFQRLLGPTG